MNWDGVILDTRSAPVAAAAETDRIATIGEARHGIMLMVKTMSAVARC